MESQASDDIVDKGLDEWSDLKCMQIAAEDKFPEIVKDLNIQKQIISRFLNFYLSGKVQKGITVIDVIFSSIAIMPRDISLEEPMWQNEEYSEEGTLFFLSPEDKLHAEIKNIINNQNEKVLEKNKENEYISNTSTITVEAVEIVGEETPRELEEEKKYHNSDSEETLVIKEDKSESEHSYKENEVQENNNKCNKYKIYENIKWFRKNTRSATMTTTEYGSTENAAFCSYCNKVLRGWDSDRQARVYLKFFFGLTALTLMRTITKSYENVINTFSSAQFYNKIRGLVDYSPPDKTCVKQCFKTLRKSDRRIKVMFAKLVVNSYILDYTPSQSTIKNVIKLGLLSHTVYFKMDLINMLQTVSIHSYQTFHVAMEVLCEVEELSASMRRVCDFIKKYLFVSKTNYLRSCYWAPILEKGQFQELSCKENYNLAVIIAVFIENLTSRQDIWKARWVENGNNLEANKQMGLKIFQHYEKQCNEESRKSLQMLLYSILPIDP